MDNWNRLPTRKWHTGCTAPNVKLMVDGGVLDKCSAAVRHVYDSFNSAMNHKMSYTTCSERTCSLQNKRLSQHISHSHHQPLVYDFTDKNSLSEWRAYAQEIGAITSFDHYDAENDAISTSTVSSTDKDYLELTLPSDYNKFELSWGSEGYDVGKLAYGGSPPGSMWSVDDAGMHIDCDDTEYLGTESDSSTASDRAACLWGYDNAWLQLDLGEDKDVLGVVTQGRVGVGQWVSKYTVWGTTDWQSFPDMTCRNVDANGWCIGNTDDSTKVTNYFSQVVRARYVRLFVRGYNSFASVRMSVIIAGGVEEKSAVDLCLCSGHGYRCDSTACTLLHNHPSPYNMVYPKTVMTDRGDVYVPGQVNLARACGTNQDQRCPTSASTEYPHHVTVASNANDGKTAEWAWVICMVGNVHCWTHETYDTAYLRIDLQHVASIGHVTVWHNGIVSIKGMQVRVGNIATNAWSNPICAEISSWPDDVDARDIPCIGQGRYLFLTWGSLKDGGTPSLRENRGLSPLEHSVTGGNHANFFAHEYMPGQVLRFEKQSTSIDANIVLTLAQDDSRHSELTLEYSDAFTTNTTAIHSLLRCTACPTGKYSPSKNINVCLDCPVGFFSAEPGATACTACHAGTYQNETGSARCRPCPQNTYSSDGMFFCKPCGSAQSSPVYSPSPQQCTCDPGYTGPNGVTDQRYEFYDTLTLQDVESKTASYCACKTGFSDSSGDASQVNKSGYSLVADGGYYYLDEGGPSGPSNPTLGGGRGQTLEVTWPDSHPFWVSESPGHGATPSSLATVGNGTTTITIPLDFEGPLYYYCELHPSMVGNITVAASETAAYSLVADGGYYYLDEGGPSGPSNPTLEAVQGQTLEVTWPNSSEQGGYHPFWVSESPGMEPRLRRWPRLAMA